MKLILFLVVCLLPVATAMSQDQSENETRGNWNVKSKTFGGKQFWTDVQFTSGWKIQQNVLTEHYRLLDPKKVRHAWGDFDACQSHLAKLLNEGEVKPNSGRVVIVLHGLIRSSNSMGVVADYLQSKSELTAINFEYASTRKSVSSHAAALGKLIHRLGDQVTEINFVGHSMGNIVVRRYLHGGFHKGFKVDPRIKRMVMIGPPNQGSQMARLLKRSLIYKAVAGAAGSQMGETWEHLEKKLATPDFEFGIIAGGQSDENESISNFFVRGKDDFTVGVEETKLPGASDFLVRPLLHSTMMKQPVTLKATLSFLENGYFTTAAAREPLAKKAK